MACDVGSWAVIMEFLISPNLHQNTEEMTWHLSHQVHSKVNGLVV